MTDTSKSVTRVSQGVHVRHGRKIVVTIGPGDSVGLRLQRAKETETAYLPLGLLYDIAEKRRAEAVSGFSAAPCANPRRVRNV